MSHDFIVKVPVPVDTVKFNLTPLEVLRWKVELTQNFNGKVNSDHEAAGKSAQELGLKLRDTAEPSF